MNKNSIEKMSRMNHKNGTNFLEMNRLIQI